MRKFEEYKSTPPAVLIKHALDVITEGVFEVRVPKAPRKGTGCGYWNDTAACSIAVTSINTDAPGIYITLNPINPALLNRCANRMEWFAQLSSTDSEVVRRRWLPLDFDPKRPAGVSSTNEEHEAALLRAREVREWLSEQGWPEPIFADSGNGAHLLYRIDMPNDAVSGTLVAETIRAVAAVWTDDMVSVDQTVHNAARIWKLYGTVSAKGDDTPTRPWRVSKFLSIPNGSIGVVRPDQMEALIGPMRAEREDAISTRGHRIQDMADWADEIGLRVLAGPMSLFGRGQKWVLEQCPFNPDHKKPIIGLIEGKPIFRCLHQSCSGYGWREFREKVDPGYSSPEMLADKILADDPLDPKWVESLARLSIKAYGHVMSRLKQAKIKGLRALNKTIEAERQRLIESQAADSGTPGNVYGLSIHIRQMQNEGIFPEFWDNALDGARYVGSKNDRNLFKLERDANRIMVEFHKRGLKWVSIGKVCEAIDYLMSEQGEYNPLSESIKNLRWDREPRLDMWLSMYLGAERNEYTSIVGRKWMISAVARAIRPGCQADHMLILEGAQGIGKSQALRTLGGEFYSEYGGDFSTNVDYARFVAGIVGKSIVELSELSSFKRNGVEALKHVLTTPIDRARLAYRRDPQDFPRTCVFAGTTNAQHQKYIHDSTGARRFWPVVCDKIRVDALHAARDQLWAEAYAAFQAAEDWWSVPRDIVVVEQELRQEQVTEDPWYEAISAMLTSRDSWTSEMIIPYFSPMGTTCRINMSSAELLANVLSVDLQHQTTMQVFRFQNILMKMGFRSKIIGNGSSKTRRLVLVEPDADIDLWNKIYPLIEQAPKSQRQAGAIVNQPQEEEDGR
jgi:hypothetical protein